MPVGDAVRAGCITVIGLIKAMMLSMSEYASSAAMPVFSRFPPSANRLGIGCVLGCGSSTGQYW